MANSPGVTRLPVGRGRRPGRAESAEMRAAARGAPPALLVSPAIAQDWLGGDRGAKTPPPVWPPQRPPAPPPAPPLPSSGVSARWRAVRGVGRCRNSAPGHYSYVESLGGRSNGRARASSSASLCRSGWPTAPAFRPLGTSAPPRAGRGRAAPPLPHSSRRRCRATGQPAESIPGQSGAAPRGARWQTSRSPRHCGAGPTRPAALFFLDPFQRLLDRGQPGVEGKPRQVERRMPPGPPGSRDRPAVRADHAGGLVLPAGHAALNVAHAFDVFLEFSLGTVVSRGDRLGRFLEIVEVA